jgi:hypothetical protein
VLAPGARLLPLGENMARLSQKAVEPAVALLGEMRRRAER